MSLVNTQAHRAARNAASIALADAGPGNSSIKLYTAQGGTLLGTRMLAKPCGTVRPSDGRIVWATGESPDVVMATGAATWAEWCDGSGEAISAGRVTDTAGHITDGTGAVVPHPDGVGTFVLGGTTGTSLYLGGLVLLYAGLIG
jgi:hypothetical protein